MHKICKKEGGAESGGLLFVCLRKNSFKYFENILKKGLTFWDFCCIIIHEQKIHKEGSIMKKENIIMLFQFMLDPNCALLNTLMH